MDRLDPEVLLTRLQRLIDIGIALSAEKDSTRLLEMILKGAKMVTNADGGTLYTVQDNRALRYEIMRNDSLNFQMGGSSGETIPFPPIPLYLSDGRPNDQMVAAAVALSGKTINIEDAYHAEGFDFSGPKAFDEKTGYRSTSFLTIPLRNHEDDIIGVLQLINAQHPETQAVIPFTPEDQKLAESLASQAAIALTNKGLIDDLKALFEAFIKLIADAIDEKSPYTGGHCRRVPVITMMLAEAVNNAQQGPFGDLRFTEQDYYQLKIAAWLHDCGKITTPEYVVDKATKLETIYDRIHTVDLRLDVLKRDAEIEFLRHQLATGGDPGQVSVQRRAYERRLEEIESARAFLHQANPGGEVMLEEHKARVREIAAWQFVNADGEFEQVLSGDEVENLCVDRGTLTNDERDIINGHAEVTLRMLESLPFPKPLRQVPEYAGGHHEKMDGSGYPRGLTREELSIPARILGIADIFEALTARDRPYKAGKKLSESLRIMGFMAKDQHIDADLFKLFMESGVYRQYAETYMQSEQIDEIDPAKILGN